MLLNGGRNPIGVVDRRAGDSGVHPFGTRNLELLVRSLLLKTILQIVTRSRG
jgi:hypothetical protein